MTRTLTKDGLAFWLIGLSFGVLRRLGARLVERVWAIVSDHCSGPSVAGTSSLLRKSRLCCLFQGAFGQPRASWMHAWGWGNVGDLLFPLPFVLVFPAASKLMDLPQKLLPLQHSPSPHLAFTIGPHVLPIPTVFGACEERGGAVRLVEQSPNPAWQVSAPQ